MSQKLVSRTHFRRRRTENLGWQWFWTKQSPNGQTISVGGEGYDALGSAYNGFFAAQGLPDWKPAKPVYMPDGYVLQKFSDEHYVVTQYKDEGE